MSMMGAKVLEASTNRYTGSTLWSLELKYPRFIHAEFMTHRVFSRNASSSRAIPIAKQIQAVEQHPVFPSEWGSNKPGMQAGENISRMAQTEAEGVWNLALMDAVNHANRLKDLGVHKQIVNRILEPFAYISVIVTATEWDNFFELRISELAQPEIRLLAEKIKAAMDAFEPIEATLGYVHAPYVTQAERGSLEAETLMMLSSARCARVSYLNHDGLEPDYDKDMNLANRLLRDKHASVFEHQAFPTASPQWVRNFRDWQQHRAILGL